MTVEELEAAQDKITEKIWQHAIDTGLKTDAVRPIPDGIADAKGYLEAPLKVAWVLKEPYDTTDEDGNPAGGGSSMTDMFWEKSDVDGWAIDTWQKVAYVMHGFQDNLTWDTLPWIRDHRDMIHILRNIAWINMSKMPGHTNSSDGEYSRCFRDYWKEIVMEQLRVYAPDVIIFGNTFCHFNDLGLFPGAKEDESLSNKWGKWVRYWRRGDQRLLQTYHPGWCKRQGEEGQREYVDSLIEALHLAYKELKGPRFPPSRESRP